MDGGGAWQTVPPRTKGSSPPPQDKSCWLYLTDSHNSQTRARWLHSSPEDWQALVKRATEYKVDLHGFVRVQPPGEKRLVIKATSQARRAELMQAIRASRGRWWAQCHLSPREKANLKVVYGMAAQKRLVVVDLGGRT